jgi:hypothetical protein
MPNTKAKMQPIITLTLLQSKIFHLELTNENLILIVQNDYN